MWVDGKASTGSPAGWRWIRWSSTWGTTWCGGRRGDPVRRRQPPASRRPPTGRRPAAPSTTRSSPGSVPGCRGVRPMGRTGERAGSRREWSAGRRCGRARRRDRAAGRGPALPRRSVTRRRGRSTTPSTPTGATRWSQPDGAALHVEEVGAPDAPLTVVFAHGWALRMGSWYYQRSAWPARVRCRDRAGATEVGAGRCRPSPPERAAAGSIRMVFYDQRSHGRSSRGTDPHPHDRNCSAQDLATVIATAVPTGRSCSSGTRWAGWRCSRWRAPTRRSSPTAGGRGRPAVDLGHPVPERRDRPDLPARLQPGGQGGQHRRGPVLERSWSAAGRRPRTRSGWPPASSGSPARTCRRRWWTTSTRCSATPRSRSSPTSSPACSPTTRPRRCRRWPASRRWCSAATRDRITPPGQSRFIADALPDAEFVLVERAAHLAMMEAPDRDQRRPAPVCCTAAQDVRCSGGVDAGPRHGRRPGRSA